MNLPQKSSAHASLRASAWKFLVLVGLVSLFSDLTYEGARSITGPYLRELGAGAAVVGVVAGLGEFAGYALRGVSGSLADRLRRYWGLTLFGYVLNLLAVPFLALAGGWPTAAGLILLERLGKAIRTPPRDAMLSHAVAEIGRGWGFGFHEAMDQLGALLGPLFVALVLSWQWGFRTAFGLLVIPALVALGVISLAAWFYPQPRQLEIRRAEIEVTGFFRLYWLYAGAIGLIAAGFADFSLIAFHFSRQGQVSGEWIPLFYAVAMGVDAVAALALGRLYDRFGLEVLLGVPLLSALSAPLVFWGGFWAALGGMVFWGIGMGAQESVIKAALVGLMPRERRARGFGLFQMVFGLLWFLGSAVMGILYEVSLLGLVAFSVGIQLLALPLLVLVSRGLAGKG